MKSISIITLNLIVFAIAAHAQFTQVDPTAPVTAPMTRMTIGIVISTNDAEMVWNAFRLANHALNQGDTVSVFLLGKGVETKALNF